MKYSVKFKLKTKWIYKSKGYHHRSKLSRVFVCFHFCNVVLYIEKGNSLSVRTGFLVELVSSLTRANCKHYTNIAVFKTNCVLQKSRWNIFKPQQSLGNNTATCLMLTCQSVHDKCSVKWWLLIYVLYCAVRGEGVT